jgi:hypothetical protein
MECVMTIDLLLEALGCLAVLALLGLTIWTADAAPKIVRRWRGR